MKTLSKISKLILIAGFIFTLSTLAANTSPDTGKKAKDTEKTIHDFFRFPGVLMPLHNLSKPQVQKVEVLFSTDLNGNINFVLAKTADRELKSEIERQFLKLRLSNLKHDVVNSVVLNFRTL